MHIYSDVSFSEHDTFTSSVQVFEENILINETLPFFLGYQGRKMGTIWNYLLWFIPLQILKWLGFIE